MKKIDHHDEAAQHGFTPPIPRRFLEDVRLGVGPKLLMVVMTIYQNMRDGVRPSQETLAKQLRVSLRTVNRWVNQLASLGYVKVKKRATKKGQTNEYKLSWKPCRDAEAHAIDVVPDAIVTEPTDTGGVLPYVTSGVLEVKRKENKSKNTGDAAAGSGSGQETSDPTLPSAPTDESTPQQIGAQDSMPNDADTPSSGRAKSESQLDAFDEMMKRIQIPANLRPHYGAIYAALRQSFAGQDGPKPAKAIQRALTEVSLLVESGHVDGRGPVGLIVTKAKSYAEMQDRDFRADDVRWKYEQSLVVYPDEAVDEFRKGLKWQVEHAEEELSRRTQETVHIGLPAIDGTVSDLILWFALEQHGFKESRDRFESAAMGWTLLSRQSRDVYQEYYPDVDVSKLNEFRRLWLEQHGIDISDEEGAEPS